MSSHPYFALPVDETRAQLLLTPCPGTVTTDLRASLDELVAAGAKVVVTLLTVAEIRSNQVHALADLCRASELAWFHLPIEDEGAPGDDFEVAWQKVRTRIHQYLDCHESVVIHCKGGSGRTGVLAARILMERGIPARDAMRKIKILRPNAFVHPVQVDYVRQLACAF